MVINLAVLSNITRSTANVLNWLQKRSHWYALLTFAVLGTISPGALFWYFSQKTPPFPLTTWAIPGVVTLVALAMASISLYAIWHIRLHKVDSSIEGGFKYLDALQSVTSGMRFLGVSASKLTENPREFGYMLERVCAHEGGTFDLLLCNPRSSAINKTAAKADAKEETYYKNVKMSLVLLNEHLSNPQFSERIRIRMYSPIDKSDFPAFRLHFVTGDQQRFCLVSPFGWGDKSLGRSLPQLHFGYGDSQSSMYGAFENYMNAIWDKSTPVNSAEMKALQRYLQVRIEALQSNKKLGCVLGRFQPPHKQHWKYLSETLAKCDVMFIGVTQPDTAHLSRCDHSRHRADPVANPLTYHQRKLALERLLNANGIDESRYVIEPVHFDEPVFIHEAIRPATYFVTDIDEWSQRKIQRLREHGCQVNILYDKNDLIKSETRYISATSIRQRCLAGDATWEDDIDLVVKSYLAEIDFPAMLAAASSHKAISNSQPNPAVNSDAAR